MSDVLTPEQRSFNMARIRGRNTKPEIRLRRAIWAKGMRYRTHSDLPGRPDIVFSKQRVAAFVDGCFWHKCPIHFQWPTTNPEFWRNKLTDNVSRDNTVNSILIARDWCVARFWEHEVREDVERCAEFLSEILSSPTAELKRLGGREN